MSRNKTYQRLLNSRQWRELRTSYLQSHPLCERCQREGIAAGIPGGYITSAVDCHHKRPVEGATSISGPDGMIARCFDPSNLEALCVPCHILTHKEARSHSREAHLQRESDRLKQWADRQRRLSTRGD